MKKQKTLKILSLFIAAVIFLTSFSFVIPAAAASVPTGIPVTPITGTNISSDDYYRLLYANDYVLNSAILPDFEKTGFIYDEITYKDKYVDALKVVNIGLSALSLVLSKNELAEKIIAGAKDFILNQKIDQINVNTAKMLNELGTQLEDVYNALSSDIDNQTAELSAKMSDFTVYLANIMESEKCIDTIRSFNEEKFGGKGYGEWKKELYAAYGQLLYYNESGASSADIKEAYDQLYVCASKYTVLASAITANEFTEDYSIQDVVFKYYLLRYKNNGDISMEDIINECVAFSEELYTTYVFADLCMNICFRYQLETLQTNHGDSFATKGYMLSESVNTLDRRVPFYSVIKPFIESGNAGLDLISAELSKHYVKLLNLCESYTIISHGTAQKIIYNQIVENNISTAHTVTRNGASGTEKYVVKNNSVNKGDIIHLNVIPQKLTASFTEKYTFISSNSNIADVSSDGVVTVKQNGSFSVTMAYGEYAIYTISFSSGEFFSGGRGSSENPFLIATANDLGFLASNPQYWAKGYHYKLISDISVASISQIGNESTKFCAVFDGNGHTISGLTGASLFGWNSGTIKNLNIKDAKVTSGGYFTTVALFAGGLCSVNDGIIENVTFKNGTVDVTNTAALNISSGENRYYTTVYLAVGCITGYNSGTVRRCTVSSSTVKGHQKNGTATGGLNEIGAPHSSIVSLGNIVGANPGKVEDCLAFANTDYIYIHSVSAYNNYAIGLIKSEHLCTAYFKCGGLVGENRGEVTRSIAYSNTTSYKWDYSTVKNVFLASGKDIQAKETYIYETAAQNMNGGKIISCFSDISAMNETEKMAMINAGWTLGSAPSISQKLPSSVSIYKMPAQTVYGDVASLNISGLTLVTDEGEYITEGYTVTEQVSPSGTEKAVAVDYAGCRASFSAEIVCYHDETSLVSSGDYDEKVTCLKCGKDLVYIENINAPSYVTHEHTWDAGNITKAPSHTENGEKTFTCTGCEEKRIDILPKTEEHTFNQKTESDAYLAEEAHCGEHAKYYYACICGEKCEETYISSSKYPHKNTGSPYFDNGSHWYKCSDCGEKNGKEAHVFGPWSTTVRPENGKDGEKERYCFDCGYTETEVLPASSKNGTFDQTTLIIVFSVASVALVGTIIVLLVILLKKRSS